MDGAPPPSPTLGRQWSSDADPLQRVLIAKKYSRRLAEKGRALLRDVLVPPPPPWTIRLTGLSTADLTLPSTASLTALYDAAASKLAVGASFRLVFAAKCVVSLVCRPCVPLLFSCLPTAPTPVAYRPRRSLALLPVL